MGSEEQKVRSTFCSCVKPMARPPLQKSDRFPYHVTARAHNREHFRVSLDWLWPVLEFELWTACSRFGIENHALVLMPNHFHLILTTPEADLGKAMSVVLGNVSRRTNRKSGRSGQVFGGPYFRSLITSTRYFGHALKYVYRNPVKAGLCDLVEDYRYSTLQGLHGANALGFPIHFTRPGMEIGLPLDDSNEMLRWLNRPFPSELETIIGRGLRKKRFEALKRPYDGRPITELEGLL